MCWFALPNGPPDAQTIKSKSLEHRKCAKEREDTAETKRAPNREYAARTANAQNTTRAPDG